MAEPETFEQVLGWRLLHASALAGAPLGWRIGRVPGGKQRAVARNEGRARGGRKLAEAVRARLLGRSLHLPQQCLQLRGPGLLVLVLEEGQLAEMMNVTEGVAAARVAVIGLPPIVHADPRELGQNAHGVGRLTAALGMDA